MKILCQELLQKEVLIWTSSLPVDFSSWQKSLRALEDISHLIVNSCIMMVCDCNKSYWHQELDEASSFLTTLHTKLGRFWYIAMPFGITMAGDVFQ